jgi:predicted ATPase/DNA-binding CsgD family transcriptional regulator
MASDVAGPGPGMLASSSALAHLELLPMIGREDELRRVEQELKDYRLVTVTGPGGCGKSRFAAGVVQGVIPAGRHACFIDLSPITDTGLACAAIAQALGIAEMPQLDALAVLVEGLGAQDVLLVLDDLAQLDGIGDVISRILTAAPGVNVLATSRSPLRVRGEREHPLPPLAVPSSDSIQAVEASPAGALFLARARTLGRLDTLDDVGAGDVATLVRRLDGLPLALELAASRSRVLSPVAILRRLDDPQTLSGQDSSGRYRSLNDVLAWSVGLLGPAEREVLIGAAVCTGTFDVELVEALVPGLDVMSALDSLVELGLVRFEIEIDGQRRFRMLETVRAFAAPLLLPEQSQPLRRRLTEHLVVTVGTLRRRLYRDETAGRHLAAEQDNIREALDWAELADPKLGLDLAGEMSLYWNIHGGVREGAQRLRALLASYPYPDVRRARGLVDLAELCDHFNVNEGLEFAQAADALATSLGEESVLVRAMLREIYGHLGRGDTEAAGAVAERLATSLDNVAEPRLRMQAGAVLGMIAADSGRGKVAVEYFDGAAEQARTLGDRYNEAALGVNLAAVLVSLGRSREALPVIVGAVATFRALDRSLYLAKALACLARLRADSNDIGAAGTALQEAAELADKDGLGEVDAEIHYSAAHLARLEGRPDDAARLLGAASASLAAGGHELTTPDAAIVAVDVAAVRRAIGAVRFEVLAADGSSDAKGALRDFLNVRPVKEPSGTRAILRHGDLTAREVEILRLVAKGMSDADIAQQLFISAKTASVHVSNIKAKLGVATRVEAALRARELGLGAS